MVTRWYANELVRREKSVMWERGTDAGRWETTAELGEVLRETGGQVSTGSRARSVGGSRRV